MSDPLKEASAARTKLRRIALMHAEAVARAEVKRFERVKRERIWFSRFCEPLEAQRQLFALQDSRN